MGLIGMVPDGVHGPWSTANDQDKGLLVSSEGLLLAPGSRVAVDACAGHVWIAKQGMRRGQEEDQVVVGDTERNIPHRFGTRDDKRGWCKVWVIGTRGAGACLRSSSSLFVRVRMDLFRSLFPFS